MKVRIIKKAGAFGIDCFIFQVKGWRSWKAPDDDRFNTVAQAEEAANNWVRTRGVIKEWEVEV